MKPKDDDKLKAIAKATYTLVEQAGLSGLTMPAIARTAGVATGTLYVYFKSKDELLTALYEQAKTGICNRMLCGETADMPFRARFQRRWQAWLDHRLQHGAEVLFMDQYFNSPWFSEASRTLSTRLIQDWHELIDAGKAQQVLKDVPTALLISAFAGSVRETAALVKSGALAPTTKNLALAFGLCWDGIKA